MACASHWRGELAAVLVDRLHEARANNGWRREADRIASHLEPQRHECPQQDMPDNSSAIVRGGRGGEGYFVNIVRSGYRVSAGEARRVYMYVCRWHFAYISVCRWMGCMRLKTAATARLSAFQLHQPLAAFRGEEECFFLCPLALCALLSLSLYLQPFVERSLEMRAAGSLRDGCVILVARRN